MSMTNRSDPESHIAFFDLDDTLVRGNMSLLYGRYLYEQGLISRVQAALAMSVWALFKIGLVPEKFLHTSLFRLLFQGEKADCHVRCATSFSQKFFPSVLRAQVQFELDSINTSGGKTVILSSSPSFIVHPFAELFGVQHVVTTLYQQDEQGRFSTVQPLLGRDKRHVVEELGEGYVKTSAYTDSILDITMLESVRNPVAVVPKTQLRKRAVERGWRIIEDV